MFIYQTPCILPETFLFINYLPDQHPGLSKIK
jgi:hypothetical protein